MIYPTLVLIALCLIGAFRQRGSVAIRAVTYAAVSGFVSWAIVWWLEHVARHMLLAGLAIAFLAPAIEELGRVFALSGTARLIRSRADLFIGFAGAWAAAELIWKAGFRVFTYSKGQLGIASENFVAPETLQHVAVAINTLPPVIAHGLFTVFLANRLFAGGGFLKSWLATSALHVGFNLATLALFSMVIRNDLLAIIWILASAAVLLLACKSIRTPTLARLAAPPAQR